jgi:hypothetical protein
MSALVTEILRAFAPLTRIAEAIKRDLRQTRRSKLTALLEMEVEDAINEQIRLLEDDDSDVVEYWGSMCRIGGRFCYAGDDTIEVELEGDAAAAWYMERPVSFTGCHEGCDWQATVRRSTRRRRYLTLLLDIEAR